MASGVWWAESARCHRKICRPDILSRRQYRGLARDVIGHVIHRKPPSLGASGSVDNIATRFVAILSMAAVPLYATW